MTVWQDVWERATVDQATGRIDLDGIGPDYVRVLSPMFRLTDGDGEFAVIGLNVVILLGAAE
jgi:hypothetical protein